MTQSELEQAIEQYKNSLDILDNNTNTNGQSSPEITIKEAIDILLKRDRIHEIITNNSSITGHITEENLLQLQQLDKKLKNNQDAIAPFLEELLPLFNPDPKNWWWHFSLPPKNWKQWTWFWKGVSTVPLTISFGLLADISSRFLSGGTDAFGAVFLSVQSVLALLAAGGALTDTGKEVGKKILKKTGYPEEDWQWISTALSGGFMLILFGVRLGALPAIANKYTDWGWKNYQKGDLIKAESEYQRAISLDTDNALAHYRLGLLYENLQLENAARKSYLLATQTGNQPALNNIARLYILDDKNSEAVSFIATIRARYAEQSLSFNKETEFALRKNIGWARLNQKDYNEARKELDEAFYLLLPQTSGENQKRADIYCLLAQIKDIDKQDSTEYWGECVSNANPIYPEEDQWRKIGQKRLSEIYNTP